MKTLYVLYDAHCGLCTEVKDWLATEPAFVNLRVLASSSDEAHEKFPSLPSGELAVVSDAGDVWLGDNAFIVCLWALRRYREWSHKLTSPLLRPLARRAFESVSRNRQNISHLLRLKSESELKRRLEEVTPSTCQTK